MSTTHVSLIVDMSGSMKRIEEETRNGILEYIKTLQKDDPKALLSLTAFDTVFEPWLVETRAEYVNAKKIVEQYRPRGMTALNDAIGKTVNSFKDNVRKKDKAIVVIVTDGGENSSHEFTTNEIKALVEKLQDKKNWTFVFLGANIDAFAVGQSYGLLRGNIAQYDSTPRSAIRTFENVSYGLGQFRSPDVTKTNTFFKDAGLTQDYTETALEKEDSDEKEKEIVNS